MTTKQKLTLPDPLPEWVKILRPDSRLTRQELVELLNTSMKTLERRLSEADIPFELMSRHSSYGTHSVYHYKWSDILNFLNQEGL